MKRNHLLSISVALTSKCNLRCEYCNIHNQEEISLDTHYIFSLMKALKTRTYLITFTGGEPLLHPEILKILKKACTYFQVNLNTNGTNPDKLEKAARYLDYCHISINNMKEYKTRNINISICLENNVKPIIMYTLSESNSNLSDITDIVNEIPKNCVIEFDTLYSNILTPENKYLKLSPAKEKKVFAHIKRLKQKNPEKIKTPDIILNYSENPVPVHCTAWKNSIYLHYDKTLYPCSTALVKGRILENPEDIFSMKDFSPLIKCRKCHCLSFLNMNYISRLNPGIIHHTIKYVHDFFCL